MVTSAPAPKQIGDLGRTTRGQARPQQYRATRVGLSVHLSTVVDQQPDSIQTSAVYGGVQRCPAVLVAKVWVSPGFEQDTDHLAVAVPGRVHQRGTLLFVPCVGIRPLFQQQAKVIDIRQKDSIDQLVVEGVESLQALFKCIGTRPMSKKLTTSTIPAISLWHRPWWGGFLGLGFESLLHERLLLLKHGVFDRTGKVRWVRAELRVKPSACAENTRRKKRVGLFFRQ